MTTRRPVGLLSLGLLAVALLSACAPSAPPGIPEGVPDPAGSSSTYSGEVPNFDGPWADAFASAFRRSTNDKQREVLTDGVVSGQEYAELQSDFVSCAASFGAKVTLQAGGGFTVDAGTLTSDALQKDVIPGCEADTIGYIAPLYEQSSRNPERLDESTIVVECLRKAGVVDDAYSPSQYKSDMDSNSGLDWSDSTVTDCAKDPLNIISR